MATIYRLDATSVQLARFDLDVASLTRSRLFLNDQAAKGEKRLRQPRRPDRAIPHCGIGRSGYHSRLGRGAISAETMGAIWRILLWPAAADAGN
jgi:hypothetical protein